MNAHNCKMKIKVKSLGELKEAASAFIADMDGKHNFALYGTMGAGKTTFVKEICSQLNVIEVVTSPTFALINEYHTRDGVTIFHFDFYRINKLEELYDFGYEDYLYSNHYNFIEWPEKGDEILPPDICKIHITVETDGSRTIEW